MITWNQLRDLQEADFPAYLRECDRRLTVLDAALATTKREVDFEIDAWIGRFDYHADFRARVDAEAVEALRALGVDAPDRTWRLAVVATRVWLLEIASPREEVGDRESLYGPATSPATRHGLLAEWRGARVVPADSPLGEWHLWQYATMIAEGVRDDRLGRKFGTAMVTLADLDEARLSCEIPNGTWLVVRDRARWVLA